MAAVGLGAIGAVALSTLLITHARPAAVKPEYREGLVAAHRPLSLNPLVQAGDTAVHDLGTLLYRRLLRLDGRAYPVPDLASNVVVSTDGLTYTLTLAGNLVWSDGRPLTSTDVLATLAFVQSPAEEDSALRVSWSKVKVAAGGGENRVLVFTLPAPHAAFAVMLTDLPILPLAGRSATELKGMPGHATEPMATSGRYRVLSADATTVKLDGNEHAGGSLLLHRLEMRLVSGIDEAARLLNEGSIDAVMATSPAERARVSGGGRTVTAVPTFRFVDLVFNEHAPTLVDPVVRRAIAVALDRATLVRVAGGVGRPQSGPVPPSIAWIGPAAPAPGSLDAAAAGLAAGGWAGAPRAKDGQPLTLRLSVPNVSPLPDVGAEVARQLAPLGIVVQVTPVKAERFLPDVLGSRAFDMALADWDNSADPDVSSFWRSDAVPPRGFNVSGGAPDYFLDRELDGLTTLSDIDQRRQAIAHVEAQLADDLPAVFLYTPEVSFITRADLAGVTVPSSANRFATVAAWHH
ncbi:MAG: ABC transporter substrate-binding protein [Candidatus Dormibacteria bacterium]